MQSVKAFLFLLSCLLFIMPVTAQTMTPVAAQGHNDFYNLSFENQHQETVEFSQYRGKVVLLNFWATWCPPCIREMPSMQRLYEHFAGQPFEIIALNAGESTTTVSKFLREFKEDITFTVLVDKENRSFREFGLQGLPMTLLIDKEGHLVDTTIGGYEWDKPASISKIQQLIQ